MRQKIAYFGGILTDFLTPVFFTYFLYVTALSVYSHGTISIVLGAMIHPVIAVPIAKSINLIYKTLCYITKKSYKDKSFLGGLLTFTFNFYLYIIAFAMMYLSYKARKYRISAPSHMVYVGRNDYKGSSFDRCRCPTLENDSSCTTTSDNIQLELSFHFDTIIGMAGLCIGLLVQIVTVTVSGMANTQVTLLDFILGPNVKSIECDNETISNHDEMNLQDNDKIEKVNEDYDDDSENLMSNNLEDTNNEIELRVLAEDEVEDEQEFRETDCNADEASQSNHSIEISEQMSKGVNGRKTKISYIFNSLCLVLSTLYIIGIFKTPDLFPYLFTNVTRKGAWISMTKF